MNQSGIDMSEVVMNSIIANEAVPVKDDWTLLAYLGDTRYHIMLFKQGEHKGIVSHHELGEVCIAASRWFNKEALTTMIPPSISLGAR